MVVEQIVRNKSNTSTWNDADIWLVFELIARTNPATPPTAFEKAVFDTPLRSSSTSQGGCSNYITKLISEYLRSSQSVLEGSLGKTRQGLCDSRNHKTPAGS